MLRWSWVEVHFVCFGPFWYLFLLNLGVIFLLFGALIGYFGIGIEFDNCFGVYSCSWKTFIFYVSFNSGIWFWLNVGFIFYFLDPNRLFFGVGVEFENRFVVYSCSCSTFILYVSVNSGIGFCLILGSFFTFLGLNGLLLGLGKGPNTVLGSTHVVE